MEQNILIGSVLGFTPNQNGGFYVLLAERKRYTADASLFPSPVPINAIVSFIPNTRPKNPKKLRAARIVFAPTVQEEIPEQSKG